MVLGILNCAVFVVNVNWDSINRKWNVNAWNLGNEWNAGNRFVFKTSVFSLLTKSGEFLLKVLFSNLQPYGQVLEHVQI
jgi:hypothetical protein